MAQDIELWYFRQGGYSDVQYRVVYEHDDGSTSCPCTLTVSSQASGWHGATILVEFAGPLAALLDNNGSYGSSATPDSGEAAGSRRHRSAVLLQRRGRLGSRQAPSWLTTAWQNVLRVRSWSDGGACKLQISPVGSFMLCVDYAYGYDDASSTLLPSGPAVMGWLWKYGSSGGVTDGYDPSSMPPLEASDTTASAGINATYQLVYEYMGGTFSFPGDGARFTVVNRTAAPPLQLYVQLSRSIVHPPNATALALQRVEGDTLWTVRSLPLDSAELHQAMGGGSSLLFTDTTTQATWGKQSGLGYTCKLALEGHAQEPQQDSSSVSNSPPSLTTSKLGNFIRSASLVCWSSSNGGSFSSFIRPKVEVGALLQPFLRPNQTLVGAQMVAAAASSTQHWGIAFIGVDHLTLLDSVLVNLPLSPNGPLIECRGCTTVTLENVAISHLSRPVGNLEYLYGAVSVTGVHDLMLRNVTCTDVVGANGWACVHGSFTVGTVGGFESALQQEET
ncbi:hypothetical protein TSOC_010748 [Tetrabaena socialis]|uniref:Uncharacterized protein n=1 Tax=Tetrabaena socialis TaxID=47790 RepID=A0A2J7ZSI1_9CHLO|nr:hypothetical protein TSOC_010748 [Tetrabaena socialis]|eukprot:PNH03208.1 hypothetical protein TSOC_010748 [Tetrabaena socialis]